MEILPQDPLLFDLKTVQNQSKKVFSFRKFIILCFVKNLVQLKPYMCQLRGGGGGVNSNFLGSRSFILPQQGKAIHSQYKTSKTEARIYPHFQAN